MNAERTGGLKPKHQRLVLVVVALVALAVRMAPRIGPMHGVQPKPKASPST